MIIYDQAWSTTFWTSTRSTQTFFTRSLKINPGQQSFELEFGSLWHYITRSLVIKADRRFFEFEPVLGPLRHCITRSLTFKPNRQFFEPVLTLFHLIIDDQVWSTIFWTSTRFTQTLFHSIIYDQALVNFSKVILKWRRYALLQIALVFGPVHIFTYT